MAPLNLQNAESTNKSLRSLFESIDVNYDDHITLKEWVRAFDSVDTNHNGVISRKEWCLHQGETYVFDAIANKKHIAALSRDEWQRTFSMLDTNKDGSISIEEWLSPGKEGRTVYFDLRDCRDVLIIRSLKFDFDQFGAFVVQAKSEVNNRRLYPGDRIININGHFVYGAPREDVEFHFRNAKDARFVHLTFEDQSRTVSPRGNSEAPYAPYKTIARTSFITKF